MNIQDDVGRLNNEQSAPLPLGILCRDGRVSHPAAKKSEGPDAANVRGAGHSRALFSPDLNALSNLTAEEAYKDLWWGVMAQFANGLDDQERWELAKFVTSHKPDNEKDPRGHGVKMSGGRCQA